MPSWVGDAVMATPALRALRGRFPEVHMTLLARRNLKDLLRGLPWADRVVTHRKKVGPATLARRLRAGNFDTALLLPGSFRTALIVRMAGVPNRIGYDRDGRGFLLTGRVLPLKEEGRFVPTPAVGSYLGLAAYLGAFSRDKTLELPVTPRDEAAAASALRRADVGAGEELAVLIPGASYGSAKCWPPGYFAKVADQLAGRGLRAVLAGAPSERPIISEIRRISSTPPADLAAAGLTLGGLKAVAQRAKIMITGDTGPRHIAAAVGTPVVTLFGPTDPAWTVIDFPHERQVSVPVFCGPCQRKTCPLDHRCMTRLTPPMVLEAVDDLLGKRLGSRLKVLASGLMSG